MKTAEDILNRALHNFKPSCVIVSFSGGHDSMVAAHLTAQWVKRHGHSTTFRVMAANTGIAADDWSAFVQSVARLQRWPFEMWTNPDPRWFARDALENGFKSGLSVHKVYFYYLKQRAFRACLQAHKKHQHDRVMFVTGVRREESPQRANTPEWTRSGAAVWCNPLIHWNKTAIETYRMEHELPQNPFYAVSGGSGDCYCNWHGDSTVQRLLETTPNLGRRMAFLSRIVRKRHGCGYGEPFTDWIKQARAGQLALPGFEDTPYLCASCERPKHKYNEALDDVLMSRMVW